MEGAIKYSNIFIIPRANLTLNLSTFMMTIVTISRVTNHNVSQPARCALPSSAKISPGREAPICACFFDGCEASYSRRGTPQGGANCQ
jgi:hypothetical protein